MLLQDQIEAVGIVMSQNAKDVWKYELNNDDYTKYPFDYYDKNDFMAPFASGSAQYNSMIIIPLLHRYHGSNKQWDIK